MSASLVMSACTACTSPPVLLGELVARLVDLVGGASRDQHAHAFFEKLPRGLVADAAAAAGDDRAASLDPQIHFSLSLVSLTLNGRTIEYSTRCNNNKKREGENGPRPARQGCSRHRCIARNRQGHRAISAERRMRGRNLRAQRRAARCRRPRTLARPARACSACPADVTDEAAVRQIRRRRA